MSGRKQGGGILAGPVANLTSVDPTTDYSIGGSVIAYFGEGFDPRDYDDLFTTLIIDPAKWNETLVGSAAYTTGLDHLIISTGTTIGSSIDVESIATFTDAQGEIRCRVRPSYPNPTADVILISINARIDANNYAMFGITQDPTGAFYLFVEVYNTAVLVDSFTQEVNYGSFDLKILRYGNILKFYSNGVEVFESTRFPLAAIMFAIYSDNVVSAFDVEAEVEWFYFRTYVIHGGVYIDDPVVVSDTRLRFLVPASLDEKYNEGGYAGDVDAIVVGNGGSSTLVDAFTYTFKKELRILNSTQQNTKMDIINYDNVKTPNSKLKGL